MNFHALNTALELIRALRPLVARLRQKDPRLTDQITDDASSIPANLAEGRRRAGKDRIQHFRIADGSADEVRIHVLTAQAWGHLTDEETAPSLAVLDRLLAMTWRLTH